MISSSTETRQVRKFGLLAFLFFGAACALGFWRDRDVLALFFALLSLLGLALFAIPRALTPVYHLWCKIGHGIGTAATTVLLSVVYYLVITPSALLKLLFGGRPLPMKPDKKACTYWVDRSEAVQPKERFLKRY